MDDKIESVRKDLLWREREEYVAEDIRISRRMHQIQSQLRELDPALLHFARSGDSRLSNHIRELPRLEREMISAMLKEWAQLTLEAAHLFEILDENFAAIQTCKERIAGVTKQPSEWKIHELYMSDEANDAMDRALAPRVRKGHWAKILEKLLAVKGR